MAGGVGLNLIGANHIVLTEPHYNPQLEAQAADRVHRTGQTKPVTIYKLASILATICNMIFAIFMDIHSIDFHYRMFTESTIEAYIIEKIQNKKLRLSNDILEGSSGSNNMLDIEDIKTMLGMFEVPNLSV